METTLRWLAAIVLLALFVNNPFSIGCLCSVVFLFGRTLNSQPSPIRYTCIGIMASVGAFFLNLMTGCFVTGGSLILFVVALTIVAGIRIRARKKHKQQQPNNYDDAIEAEVISITTIER